MIIIEESESEAVKEKERMQKGKNDGEKKE
jgi:hypothetical protein